MDATHYALNGRAPAKDREEDSPSVKEMRRYVVTGGLGTGKTTVIDALGGAVMAITEPARELIAQHRAETGGASLDGDPERFVERLVDLSIEKHQSVPQGATAVFDRGVPDCVAYATVYGIDPDPAIEAAARYRYESPVFVAPPWKEIYATDEMRTATYAQAEEFHTAVVSAYDDLGYELIELPRASAEERAAFISARIS